MIPMQTRVGKFTVFFFIVGICLFLLLFSHFSFFAPLRGLIEDGSITIQKIVTGSEKRTDQTALEKLQTQNQTLQTQLAKQSLILQENQALHDQFAKSPETSRSLLPATVISHREYSRILIDKGALDGVKKGQAVVINDNLIGQIVSTTPHISHIQLSVDKNFSIASQTIKTNAIGITRGEAEDGILLQNVLLSDTLEKGDYVVTKGDKDDKGDGLPPNLIIGKIMSLDKKASALYQTAKVESVIDLSRLRTVFVLLQ